MNFDKPIRAYLFTLLGLVIVGAIIGALLYHTVETVHRVGNPFYPNEYKPGEDGTLQGLAPEGISVALNLSMGAFRGFQETILLAFAAVAFLVSFQGTRQASLKPREAWALVASIGSLVIALFCALAGQEMLLFMIEQNNVALDFQWLRVAHYLLHIFFFTGIIAIGAYAVSIAFVPATDDHASLAASPTSG